MMLKVMTLAREIHRTEGLISTTQQTVTMTTDIRSEFLEDVSEPNGFAHFDIQPTFAVSAEIWTIPSRGNVIGARLELLKHVCGWLFQLHPGWELWLLAAHRAVQPDNRIVQYHRLWNSLEKRGASFRETTGIKDGERSESGGVRFFGARMFGLDELGSVDLVLRSETGAIVGGNPEKLHPAVSLLANDGWEISSVPVANDIVNLICESGGVVFSVFGEFDDREVGIALIGSRQSLGRL
jgi:hypothetical protein